MDKKQISRLSKDIADGLLIYYHIPIRKAQRLVLELDDRLDGPGLDRNAIINRVAEILRDSR